VNHFVTHWIWWDGFIVGAGLGIFLKTALDMLGRRDQRKMLGKWEKRAREKGHRKVDEHDQGIEP
jgi:hypothetical protein